MWRIGRGGPNEPIYNPGHEIWLTLVGVIALSIVLGVLALSGVVD